MSLKGVRGSEARELHYKKEITSYRKRIEQSFVVTLILASLFFTFFRQLSEKPVSGRKVRYVKLTVEDIPITRHKHIPKTPLLPQVPIPSEDDFIPTDETIELMETIYDEDFSSFADGMEIDESVIPIFPDTQPEDAKPTNGVIRLAVLINQFGQVDSVRVLENTTRSNKDERNAIRAAYRTRYVWEVEHEETFQWIERSFHFEIN